MRSDLLSLNNMSNKFRNYEVNKSVYLMKSYLYKKDQFFLFLIIIKMSDREIARLESDLNCCKREKEVMEQNFDRRRQRILNQMRAASSQPNAADIARNLMMETMALDREYSRESEKMNNKIFEARQALFKKLQN